MVIAAATIAQAEALGHVIRSYLLATRDDEPPLITQVLARLARPPSSSRQASTKAVRLKRASHDYWRWIAITTTSSTMYQLWKGATRMSG